MLYVYFVTHCQHIYFLSIVTYSWNVSHNEILFTSTNVKYLNFVRSTMSNFNYGFSYGFMFTIFHNE
jgi:hypothetical protein